MTLTTRRRLIARARAAFRSTAAATALTAVGCAALPPAAGSIDSLQRLDALDRPWTGIKQPARITWDNHLIPSIHAESEHDAAFALGLVHAHLRSPQMELIRRVSQGRLAESLGPPAAGIDHAIRAIHLDRAVPEIERQLPHDSRRWIERYVEGVNAYRQTIDRRPADARLLDLDLNDPWTVRDVLTIGRLASVDVHWGRIVSLLPLRNDTGYNDYVQRLWSFGDAGTPSFGPEQRTPLSTLIDIGRTGSNAFAVAGSRTNSGSALMAADPHLGLSQPNLWCIVGYRTPDHAAVGLTIPGLPFILIGRNQHIAWSGTNMQSSSSVLYELPDDDQPTTNREEHIGVRFWFDRTATIPEHTLGPVISDAPFLDNLADNPVALKWRGHDPSDEATAFYRLARATTFDQFRKAFATYAVGGQNMLYADTLGNIGQVMAIEAVPAAAIAARNLPVPANSPDHAWTPGIPSNQLPHAFNPPTGVLVSANNVPLRLDAPLIPQGNANDRVNRAINILGDQRTLTIQDLHALQQDVYSEASHATAKRIAEHAAPLTNTRNRDLVTAIAQWDGHYHQHSTGAAAYQAALHELINALYSNRYSDGIRSVLRRSPAVHAFVREDLATFDDTDALRRAITRAARAWSPDTTWGDVHRLRLAHPIAAAPVIGRPFRFDDIPVPGSSTTLYKSAHSVGKGTRRVSFGANARVLFDLADSDASTVVLLGGQDGTLGSDRLLDQTTLWQAGRTIPLPLSTDAQNARAARITHIRPESH